SMHRSQIHNPHAVGERVDQACRDQERKLRLAAATGTGQCHQPPRCLESQISHRGAVPLASEKLSTQRGQVVSPCGGTDAASPRPWDRRVHLPTLSLASQCMRLGSPGTLALPALWVASPRSRIGEGDRQGGAPSGPPSTRVLGGCRGEAGRGPVFSLAVQFTSLLNAVTWGHSSARHSNEK